MDYLIDAPLPSPKIGNNLQQRLNYSIKPPALSTQIMQYYMFAFKDKI